MSFPYVEVEVLAFRFVVLGEKNLVLGGRRGRIRDWVQGGLHAGQNWKLEAGDR